MRILAIIEIIDLSSAIRNRDVVLHVEALYGLTFDGLLRVRRDEADDEPRR
jgi:hypothetical protein